MAWGSVGLLSFSRCPTSSFEPAGPWGKEKHGWHRWADELGLGDSATSLLSLKLPRIWSLFCVSCRNSIPLRSAIPVGSTSGISVRWDPCCADVGRKGRGRGEVSLFFSPHKCGFTQYLHEVLFMDKVKLYFESARVAEQAPQRASGVSFPGDIPTCLDMILGNLPSGLWWSREIGLDGLQRCLPSPTTLWWYDWVFIYKDLCSWAGCVSQRDLNELINPRTLYHCSNAGE